VKKVKENGGPGPVGKKVAIFSHFDAEIGNGLKQIFLSQN
jgi:hypothetical protein